MYRRWQELEPYLPDDVREGRSRSCATRTAFRPRSWTRAARCSTGSRPTSSRRSRTARAASAAEARPRRRGGAAGASARARPRGSWSSTALLAVIVRARSPEVEDWPSTRSTISRTVLTPRQAKGLEFDQVVVVEPQLVEAEGGRSRVARALRRAHAADEDARRRARAAAARRPIRADLGDGDAVRRAERAPGAIRRSVSQILGADLTGVYHPGSFALGGGDAASDCDFLAVTTVPLGDAEEPALRGLHQEIPDWPSMATTSRARTRRRAELTTLAKLDEPWLYVNRGGREMEWSPHCNTADVRWVLVNGPVVLAGADPRTFACDVPAAVLQKAMRPQIESFLVDLGTWASFDVSWTSDTRSRRAAGCSTRSNRAR